MLRGVTCFLTYIHTYIHVNLTRIDSGLAITLEGNVDTYLWVMKVTAAI